jgi:hypothetical protein
MPLQPPTMFLPDGEKPVREPLTHRSTLPPELGSKG